ncbi:MAG: fibronectin type III domain-containing protein, partial [Kiritimatiellae bacterium]|nr:fibronectin type III domain-containing protein [Kiritimatiellia bacterium]
METFFSGFSNHWKLFYGVLAALLCAFSVQAESLRGDMNGWGISWMAQDTAYGNYWALTLTNTASAGTCYYKFDQDGDYDPQWGTGIDSQNATANASLGQARIGSSAGNLQSSLTTGSVVTVRLAGDSSWWDRQFVVMETTQWPAAITSVTHNAIAAGTNAVTVTLYLDRTKSTQESLYVRWTTNDWSSSSFITATGTTAVMSATIPAQTNGTPVRFYALTSTMPQNTVEQQPDFCTLRGNNAGSNYYYVAETPATEIPLPPSGLNTGDVTKTSFTASWAASSGATNYFLDVSTASSFDSYVSGYENRSVGNVTSASVTGLTASTMYSFRLRAQNAEGTSSNSATQSVTTADPLYGNCWHYPTNQEPGTATMRNPVSPDASDTVYLYSGNYQTDGDQTGGWLFHRAVAAGAWASNALTYDTAIGSNHYWKTTIPGDTYTNGASIEYVLCVDYANDPALSSTYLGTSDGSNNVKAATLADAASNAFSFTYTEAPADLGNCWHIYGNYEPQGAYMRNPRNPYADSPVYFYNGNQFAGDGNPGNQNGGSLKYRLKDDSTWTSASLTFDIEAENNKYWKANIPADTFVATNEIEYYLLVTYSDHDDTYLGTTNLGAASLTYADEADAQANPFSFRYGGAAGDEAGYIWHASNVVKVGESSAQFWTKIGYAQGTGTNRWVSDCVLYYTTNGTDPSITGLGVAGNADTYVQAMTFDHMEEDSYEGGDAMWWMGTITNIPTGDGSLVKYKIGAWNTNGNNVERRAEYNTLEGSADRLFTYSLYVAGADGLRISADGGSTWLNADYTTTKFFINEIDGDTAQIVVHYKPVGAPDVKNVELYSNLGRRDYVDVDYTNQYISTDGYADGICPPDGNLISTNDTGAYYIAIPMAGGPNDYYWTGTVSRCGAYRLTARHQTADETNPTNWVWYSSDGRRDHAIVISPTKVHEMTLYELNALTVNATNTEEDGRSTFSSLTNASNGKFNLEWLNYIQANCLWFQPIHPSAATQRGDSSGSTPGSPYATRNYFAVSGYFGDAGTEEDAMNEFTNFVIACDNYAGSVGTINIMLDGVFNHTAWDAQMGAGGVELGYCGDPSASMGSTMPGWYSLWTDYGEPATYYTGVYSNDIATAPDRGDFGKWDDVAELYFGKYSALVRHNPDDNANYKNEGDVYDFTGMSTDTKKLWKYFGYYADFWLEKTGHAGTNAWVASLDNKGLDGLRCDFGQGLPPQFWEYFINHTRAMKWNFVFMAETLDGGIPGYRSNRHFDILNEDLVFKFTQAHISQTWEFKDAYEQRRNAYSG